MSSPPTRRRTLALLLVLTLAGALAAQTPAPSVTPAKAAPVLAWPAGARMALSLTFDDGRASQVDVGLPIFERHGARVTFYVVPSAVARKLDGWKAAVRAGHEIGNHSLTHPCSGNFAWARARALESYTMARMRAELVDANRRIESLLGVRPRSFAYPCGQTFIGRGTTTRSYVPLVAALFLSGRGWLDEGPPDPLFVDLAQVPGQELDGREMEDLQPLIDDTRARGGWLVLAGHDIGESGRQTTRVRTLERLLAAATAPASGIWLAPIGEVAAHVQRHRPTPR
jgi:peptidoglycan/xylan/chitin deacetylase (PgdA/CDA1 family)